MRNNFSFGNFILLLVFVSTCLAYGISCMLQLYKINVPFYIELPSISAIYAILFWIFDRYLWKLLIFKKIGIIVADDLSGIWKGVVKSSYDDFKSEIYAELDIQQSATRIKIRGVFNQSKSVSIHENFSVSEIDGKAALFYFFRNEPNYDAEETMAIHEGSVKLIHDKTSDTLEGYYYSGRDRNNHGTIKVKRVK